MKSLKKNKNYKDDEDAHEDWLVGVCEEKEHFLINN